MRYVIAALIILSAVAAYGQTPQIPTLQVCNASQVNGGGTVSIASRAGTFDVAVEQVICNPKTGYPSGSVRISTKMNDTFAPTMTFSSSMIDQVTSTGSASPNAFISGRCTSQPAVLGCRFWLLVADNRSATPDVVGFLVVNEAGKRVAYGTGPLAKGDIVVKPTAN